MVKVLAVLLLSLAGFYLGYKLYKANKEENEGVSMYATITLICALLGGLILVSYLLLRESGWTDDSKAMMRLIIVSGVGISFLFLGIKLIIRGRRSTDKLTQIAGLSWILVTLFASGFCLSYISKMNDGWTAEKRENVMNHCLKLADQGKAYNCPCFVEKAVKAYKTPDDFTKSMENESTGKKEEFENKMLEDCACGGKSYSEEEVESIDF